MIALLLAAALAGPPSPTDWQAAHTDKHVEIARVADGTALDLTILGLGAGADLLSTSAAMRWCPTCLEGNPLGWDTEARVAGKLGMVSIVGVSCYGLRRTGHHNWATGFRYVAFGLQMAAATSNTIHAIRGK